MAGFTPEMKEWMKLVVRDAPRKVIMEEIFHVAPEDMNEENLHKYDCKLSRWRNHPDYQKEWLAAFKGLWGPIMTKAANVVNEGLMDDSLPWRKTQHANMALAYGSKILIGEEERSINVKVEGLPEIGSPDDA